MQTHTGTNTNIHTHTETQTHMRTHTQIHTRRHKHTHTPRYPQPQTHRYTQIHSQIHMQTHTDTDIYTQPDRDTDTHIVTDTHMYTPHRSRAPRPPFSARSSSFPPGRWSPWVVTSPRATPPGAQGLQPSPPQGQVCEFLSFSSAASVPKWQGQE